MAELVTCATETNVCSVCGRSAPQNVAIATLQTIGRCTTVTQAAGSFNYMQATREERAGGPHIL